MEMSERRSNIESSVESFDPTVLWKWYKECLASNCGYTYHRTAALRATEDDILDIELAQERISNLVSTLEQFELFCSECQKAFEQLFDAENVCVRRFHSITLEAAARRGCRFCSFLLQIMEDEKTLETYRRIEIRLELLSQDARSSVSVESDGYAVMSLPGKLRGYVGDGTGYESYGGGFQIFELDENGKPIHISTYRMTLTSCSRHVRPVSLQSRHRSLLVTRVL